MSIIGKTIAGIMASKEYLLYNKYHEGNLFGITKTARLESLHSNFIAWLLDSRGIHNLRDYPIKQFLIALLIAKDRMNNQNAQFSAEVVNLIEQSRMSPKDALSSKCKREVSFHTGQKKRSIDLVVEVDFGKKILPVIIENKVNSFEHNDQTIDYYQWAEKEYSDKNRYCDAVYVFLTPDYNTSVPKSDKFLLLKYQDLVDFVFEPSLWKNTDSIATRILDEYLKCLSFNTDFSKGENVMALSNDERALLETFYMKNKNFVVALMGMMAEDDDVDPDLKARMNKTVAGRDYSKYEFNGTIYQKNKLVLAVVKKYVDEHQNLTFADLEKVFPKKLQGSLGVIKRLNSLSQKEMLDKRFYVDQADQITLGDGTVVVVCTQWGIENITLFIEHAQKVLKYSIIKQ